MKFLTVASFEKLNDILRLVEVGEQVFKGCVHCLTLKMVKDDKRLASHLRRAFSSETIASRFMEEHFDVHSSMTFRDAMKRAVCTPLGSLRDAHTLKLMEYLISTLNNVYQDEFDFTDVQPQQFSKVVSLEAAQRMVEKQLQALDRTMVSLATSLSKKSGGAAVASSPLKRTATGSRASPALTAVSGSHSHSQLLVKHRANGSQRAMADGSSAVESASLMPATMRLPTAVSFAKSAPTVPVSESDREATDSGTVDGSGRVFGGLFLSYFWQTIDEVIDLNNCEIYRFHPTDSELGSMRPHCLWSADLFFLNDSLKQLVYVSLASMSKLFIRRTSSKRMPIPRPWSPLLAAVSASGSMDEDSETPTTYALSGVDSDSAMLLSSASQMAADSLMAGGSTGLSPVVDDMLHADMGWLPLDELEPTRDAVSVPRYAADADISMHSHVV